MRHKIGSAAINGTVRRVLLTNVGAGMQRVFNFLRVCFELLLSRGGGDFLQLLSEIFIIVRILQRYYHKCTEDFI